MIARLIAWSARNLILVFVAAAFAVAAGVYALKTLPLDAIPDLSDVQVIVYTEYPGQAPQVIEDQVTYPLTTSMLTVPKARVVRGFSFFGVSFVYVIFEDGTDPYWARSRVLEYLNAAARRLPTGVSPTLGPDATGVGWVYQYAVMAKEMTLAELRSVQDWSVRFAASRAEGAAEVASVGGFVKQYAIVVDPVRLRAQGVSLASLREAVRNSNMDVGGRTVELAEFEFVVRGRGYLQSIAFRACRLVVDTGLHAKRWTREQAVQWFAETNGSGLAEVAPEVDRYCSWPGQACGYKMGHTEILSLRDKARRELGDKYDLRDFNDAVVTGGNVPLDVLGQNVDRYIAAAKG